MKKRVKHLTWKNDRRYDFIEGVTIFDKKIIFNKTVNLTNRYRLDDSNIPIVNRSIETKNSKNKTKINYSMFNNYAKRNRIQ